MGISLQNALIFPAKVKRSAWSLSLEKKIPGWKILQKMSCTEHREQVKNKVNYWCSLYAFQVPPL